MKDDSTRRKKITQRENVDTNPGIDKNRELYKLLEIAQTERIKGEDIPAQNILVAMITNRIALSNKNKLLWTKHINNTTEKR